MAARRINSGLLANKLNPLSIVPSALIAAVVFVGVQYFWHMSNTLSELVICGLVFLACFFGLNLLMQYFSSKKNDDLLKQ